MTPVARYKKAGPNFTGCHFSDEEKAFELEGLRLAIKCEEVDKEIIPFLERLNRIPWIVTLWSCTGHSPKSGGYVIIRIRKPFEEFLTLVYPFARRCQIVSVETKRGNVSFKRCNTVDLNGLYYNRPGFNIHCNASTWDNELEFFTSLCENAD